MTNPRTAYILTYAYLKKQRDSIVFHNVSHQVFLKKAAELINKSGFPPVTPLQMETFSASASRHNFIAEYRNEQEKNIAFLVPSLLLTTNSKPDGLPQTLILSSYKDGVKSIQNDFNRLSIQNYGIHSPAFLKEDETFVNQIHLLKKNPAIIIGTTNRTIDHLRRNNLQLKQVKTLILDITQTGERSSFDKDILFIFTKLPKKVTILIFIRDYQDLNGLGSIIKRPRVSSIKVREKEDLHKDKNSSQEDKMTDDEEKRVKTKIEEIISTIKEGEDPLILKDYKKLIKKYVPFHIRGYFSAFLFKNLVQDRPVKHRKINDNMQTVFINIGKTRRVYPKDLLLFFQKSLNLATDQIGSIKVLANYSFVDLDKKVAAEAVEHLDGKTFRGKKIIVNFARKKE